MRTVVGGCGFTINRCLPVRCIKYTYLVSEYISFWRESKEGRTFETTSKCARVHNQACDTAAAVVGLLFLAGGSAGEYKVRQHCDAKQNTYWVRKVRTV